MARLRVLIAMTLDGSIPAEDDPLRQWLRDDKDGFSYGRGKSLIDEIIIFLFPSTRPDYKSVSKHIPQGEWKIVNTKTFKNGICRLIYCKTLQ